MNWRNRVLRLRGRLGWSQRRLAMELGMSQQAVSRLECGETEPNGPLSIVLALMEAGYMPSELLRNRRAA